MYRKSSSSYGRVLTTLKKWKVLLDVFKTTKSRFGKSGKAQPHRAPYRLTHVFANANEALLYSLMDYKNQDKPVRGSTRE